MIIILILLVIILILLIVTRFSNGANGSAHQNDRNLLNKKAVVSEVNIELTKRKEAAEARAKEAALAKMKRDGILDENTLKKKKVTGPITTSNSSELTKRKEAAEARAKEAALAKMKRDGILDENTLKKKEVTGPITTSNSSELTKRKEEKEANISNLNKLCEADFKKFVEKRKIEKHIINKIKNIYTFAYFYGDDILNGRAVNFSEIGTKKKDMFNGILSEYGEIAHKLSSDAFSVAFNIASKSGKKDNVSEKTPGPYYKYDFEYKYFTRFDNPTEFVKQSLLGSFSNAFYETNQRNSIINLTGEIKEAKIFKDIITDKEWSKTYIRYCFSVFTQWIHIKYFYSYYNKGNREAEKHMLRYKKTFNDLETEMKNRGFEKAVINFHMEYLLSLLDQAEYFAFSDECRYLLDNKKYQNEDDGILRLEMFISANTFGF
jgi:hypothetical protein